MFTPTTGNKDGDGASADSSPRRLIRKASELMLTGAAKITKIWTPTMGDGENIQETREGEGEQEEDDDDDAYKVTRNLDSNGHCSKSSNGTPGNRSNGT